MPEQELRQATQHFADLILAMDHAAIAALFTPDGEMVAAGQPPIRGSAEIGKHLESFKAFHVLAESMTADTITVNGPDGHVAGVFHQRVRLPSGEVVEASGDYAADWSRDAAGVWRIRRMATTAKP